MTTGPRMTRTGQTTKVIDFYHLILISFSLNSQHHGAFSTRHWQANTDSKILFVPHVFEPVWRYGSCDAAVHLYGRAMEAAPATSGNDALMVGRDRLVRGIWQMLMHALCLQPLTCCGRCCADYAAAGHHRLPPAVVGAIWLHCMPGLLCMGVSFPGCWACAGVTAPSIHALLHGACILATMVTLRSRTLALLTWHRMRGGVQMLQGRNARTYPRLLLLL